MQVHIHANARTCIARRGLPAQAKPNSLQCRSEAQAADSCLVRHRRTLLSLSGGIGLDDADPDTLAKPKKRRSLMPPPAAMNVVSLGPQCCTAVNQQASCALVVTQAALRAAAAILSLNACCMQAMVMLGCAAWMGVSSGLILVNKHCMSVDGFAYPMALSGLGMAFSSVASFLCCKVISAPTG